MQATMTKTTTQDVNDAIVVLAQYDGTAKNAVEIRATSKKTGTTIALRLRNPECFSMRLGRTAAWGWFVDVLEGGSWTFAGTAAHAAPLYGWSFKASAKSKVQSAQLLKSIEWLLNSTLCGRNLDNSIEWSIR